MKRRILIFCLCLCLLLASVPVGVHADNKVNFISLNDTLPPELVNGFTYYGGTIYVPAWIFGSYGFGIYINYSAETNIATLYTGGRELNFDISNGVTYDESGNKYTLPAIMWGGNIFVPISYVASYFGTFQFSAINTDYGTVLRIKDSRVVLTDTEFVKAAMNMIKQYYNAFNKEPEKDETQDSSTPDNGQNRMGLDVLLYFSSMPGDEELAVLEQYGIKSCFFLTGEQVKADADRLRRLVCQGHRIGVLWEGDPAAADETIQLIFEAARETTVLIASSAEQAQACAEYAQERAYVHMIPDIEALYGPEEDISPFVITSNIEVAEDSTAVLINAQSGMAETIGIVLNYLKINKYDVFTPSEIVQVGAM